MAKLTKSRLDELLVATGRAESLAIARSLIMSGDVIVDDQRIDKPGTLVLQSSSVRLRDAGRFVSRGGEKLFGAIVGFKLEEHFKGAVVLDVGASTGGFTDCVLHFQASTVIAVDVGTAQLDWSLRQNSKVISVEKTDIKDFNSSLFAEIDWVVADVSFTSLSRLIPAIKKAAAKAKVLLLIKPQFELPRELVPQGGIVTDDNDRQLAITQVRDSLLQCNYQIIGEQDSVVTGKQGNREIFIYAISG